MPRRKMRRPWGCIVESRRGKKYVLRWMDGGRRRCETFYGSYRAADERLAEIRAEIRARGDQGASAPTLAEAWERWYLPSAKRRIESGKLKPSSLDQYERMWRYFIADRWGGCRVTDIKPIDVEDWMHTLTRSNGKLCRAIMSNVMNECLKREVIASNPMRVKMVESPLGTEMDRGIWTLEELDEMAWRSRGSLHFYSVILMAFGSCRPGESLGPKLSEVKPRECRDMRFAEVRIERQMRRSGRMSEADDLKNKWSTRTVFVPEPWCLPLLDRVARAGAGEVFVTETSPGVGASQQDVVKSWNRAFSTGAMGSLERHPWKNLRPAWETWMNWRNHVDSAKIEKLMGHKAKGVTGIYYDRPLDMQLMEEIARGFEGYPYRSPYPWG